ncbi:hypothetical protein [Glycomyces sp. NPDC047010]|uniref:hypothetical protein n=1 Tax=Glycomyces sp. NPDC047010 TaxID=3155023 RepID=UPI0033F26869
MDAKLEPDTKLCAFAGPEDEEFALIVSRTGRSVAVRHADSPRTRRAVARIWYPLSAEPRVEVEDRWRIRSTAWMASLKERAARALTDSLPTEMREPANHTLTLSPSSTLGTFTSPGGRNQIYMTVSRTGKTVTARLGSERGQIIARAHRPSSSDPGIAFQGLYRQNASVWQYEFNNLFRTALSRAVGLAPTRASAP